jgi:hypothetical protein
MNRVKCPSGEEGPSVSTKTQTQPDKAAVGAALAILDRFMAALNAGDEPALIATLHFPRYRLAGGRMRVWDRAGAYLGDFLVRAGADWHHSEWDFRRVTAAGPAKVHLDVQFTRYRIDKAPAELLAKLGGHNTFAGAGSDRRASSTLRADP